MRRHQSAATATPERELYRLLICMPLVLLLAAVTGLYCGQCAGAESAADVPGVRREFRGVWVATAWNIDWPTKPGLSTAAQQSEVRYLLDRATALGLNAVVLQVRSEADAIYPTEQPWSRSLTGTPGAAPDPAYDPLQYWIREAHRRGLELHAWINPFRAQSSSRPVAAEHVSRTDPQLVVQYGDQHWIDPGQAGSIAHVLRVVDDLLNRYDLDGLQLDDYFYPYPVRDEDGAVLEFPDKASWEAYLQAGGQLPRDDWRRSRVNRLISSIRARVRRLRPDIRFGISPFGLPGHGLMPEVQGLDQYSELYAEPQLWAERSWCDYLSPQLYWRTADSKRAFGVLLNHWSGLQKSQLQIWPGLYASAVADAKNGWTGEEIAEQIRLTRERLEVPGHLHFSARALLRDESELFEELRQTVYQDAAAVPVRAGIAERTENEPGVSISGAKLSVRAAGVRPRRWCLQARDRSGQWRQWLFSGQLDQLLIPSGSVELAVSELDHLSRQGVVVRLTVNKFAAAERQQ